MKNSILFFGCVWFLSGCGVGDVGSSKTTVDSTSATDNSTDNSLHGISKCDFGTSQVCDPMGDGTVGVSQICINADGTPVVKQGPDILPSCPVPTPEPAPAPVPAG